MNENSKSKQQLLLEMEELRTRLDVAEQRLQEADERMQAEMTDRKRVEEDFVRAQKHAEGIVETIREPLLVLTADLKVISANQSFYETFKVTPEETEGRFIYSVGNHQWDIPALRKLLEEIVPQNSKFTGFEVDHEFPSIGRKMMLLNARRIHRQGKGTEMILLAIEDVTERNQTREELEISETRYRRLFETAQDGILIIDADTGQISDVNPFLIEMLGYSHEDFLGKRLWEIGAFKDIEASQRAFSELQTRGYVRYEDLPLQTRDGRSMAVEFVSNVYLVNHHKVIQCNIRDITERKRAEEALRKAHDELEKRVKTRTADLAKANEQLVASAEALKSRLRFERLLSDLSARFVNMPPDQVDSEIEAGLGKVLKLFQVDHCGLIRTLPGKTSYQITHVASADDVPPVPAGVELPRSIYPWAYEKLTEKHEVMCISRLDDLPAEANVDRQTCIEWGIRSYVNIPLLIGESVDHIIHVSSLKSERVWQEELFPRLQLLGEIFVNALEIKELRQRLEKENIYLQEEVKLLIEHTDIVGQSVVMKEVLTQAEQVAQTDSTVLLVGETGTGKELLARTIHKMSARKDRPLVTVNCASLPPTLIESELFGREKGAYTGALSRMIGRFEIADGSTLFLDEIGELPLDLQSKLLRVLEDGTFERLGSTKPLRVNVRIIAATNRDIEQEVKDGKFRRDLFYRLNVFPIVIPPLRERPEDIPLLVRAVVKEFQKRMGKEIESIPKKTMQALQSYSWPGNVRELRNLIEHAMILSRGKTLEAHVPKLAFSETDAAGNLQDMERIHMVAVLEKTGWRIGGQGGAAEVLGLKRTTLLSKMKKLGIKRSNKSMSN